MSLQVGSFCFATPADAGVAACARFQPVTSVVDGGASVRSVSCVSADSGTGALNLRVSTSPVDGSASSYSTISQVIAYSPCQESQYYDFAGVLLGSVLSIGCAVWGVLKIIQLLDHSRGNAE